MIAMVHRTKAVLFFTLVAFLTVAAFLRGRYLLGTDYGISYAIIAACLLCILTRYLMRTRRLSLWRVVAFVVLVLLPVSYAMAFPASVNPGLQHFIDKYEVDRAMRRELIDVFASDPSYGDLSISTTHLKVVIVTIHGRLKSQTDLDRLRSRIAAECPSLSDKIPNFDIRIDRDIDGR